MLVEMRNLYKEEENLKGNADILNQYRRKCTMKKIILNEQVKIKAVKNFRGNKKLIDYYIEQPRRKSIYAFTRTFTNNTYDMCKAGIRVNELSLKKSRDKAVMGLVKYLNIMLPYLSEYYELPVIA